MNCVFNMMDCVFNMMDCVFEMMDFTGTTGCARLTARCTTALIRTALGKSAAPTATPGGTVTIYIKIDEFCIKNDGFCIEYDEFCIKNDDFNANEQGTW